jgi:hypothetical protein
MRLKLMIEDETEAGGWKAVPPVWERVPASFDARLSC